MTREQRLADAFVALAGSTAAGPLDIPGTLSVLVNRAPPLLGARAAAVVFAPDGYAAAHVAGSDLDVSRLELEAVAWREGPGHDCHQTDRPGIQTTLDSLPTRQRWPHYTPRALRLGYTSVAAIPLREPTGTSGALVLLSGERRALAPGALAIGRSMADFTAVILKRACEANRSRTLTAQLEQALTGRVIIEQAKGVLANRRSVTPDEAFELLRTHARSRQRPVRDVAREVVDGHADPGLTGPTQ